MEGRAGSTTIGYNYNFMATVYIAVFGVCGVLLRYGIQTLAARAFSTPWPLGTFAINLLGSFLIGVVGGLSFSEDLRTAILVGFLGGFTTFSAFSFETVLLWQKGEALLAVAYLTLSPLLGVACAWAGKTLVAR